MCEFSEVMDFLNAWDSGEDEDCGLDRYDGEP